MPVCEKTHCLKLRALQVSLLLLCVVLTVRSFLAVFVFVLTVAVITTYFASMEARLNPKMATMQVVDVQCLALVMPWPFCS